MRLRVKWLRHTRTQPLCRCLLSSRHKSSQPRQPNVFMGCPNANKCSVVGILRDGLDRSRISSIPASREGSEVLDTLNKDELEVLLQGAIRSEEYARAAAIKARIDKIIQEDPRSCLKKELESAVNEERYHDAARIKQELTDLKVREEVELLKSLPYVPTISEAETRGIKVHVESFFVPHQSVAAFEQYVFAYKVTISNVGTSTVCLLTRHWKITDGNGEIKHVRGNGVVGREPIFIPGGSFEYTSICPLPTPHGTMEGEYNMVVLDDAGEYVGHFQAKIAQFALKMDSTDIS